MKMVAGRAAWVVACALAGLALSPPETRLEALAAGAAVGLAAIVLEELARRAPSRVVSGSAVGLLAGLAAAALASLAIFPWVAEKGALESSVAPVLLTLAAAWIGLTAGARHASLVPVAAAPGAGAARASAPPRSAARQPGAGAPSVKVMDTSVVIDGRIADVIAAGFLEGTLVVPQFVLRELQQVADSSDPLKRNRGRKGLDILKAIQDSDRTRVEVTDRDFPEVREVDGKLLCLAEELGGKILTNDYNLNKVAQLRGVPVLNVNDLANAMKPVVLPGEMLALQVIKEGKERNQGVGYLDDGTMVVIDNGKRLIGQKVDVVVTSVIQTNAGKMIFGQGADESEPPPRSRVVARRTSDSPASVGQG